MTITLPTTPEQRKALEALGWTPDEGAPDPCEYWDHGDGYSELVIEMDGFTVCWGDAIQIAQAMVALGYVERR